jgi:hypothetical protein
VHVSGLAFLLRCLQLDGIGNGLVFEPAVFASIRGYFHVDSVELSKQFSPQLLADGLISSKFSDVCRQTAAVSLVPCLLTRAWCHWCRQGRSSSFFCFSADRRHIVKTISSSEAESLLQFLPAYRQYLAYVSVFANLACLLVFLVTPLYFSSSLLVFNLHSYFLLLLACPP